MLLFPAVSMRNFFLLCLIGGLWFGSPPVLLASGGRPPARDPAPATPASFVPVRTFARTFGFTRVQESETDLRLQGREFSLVFEKGGRHALVNDTLIWLHQPVIVDQGQWSLTRADIDTHLAPVLTPAPGLAGLGHRVIVIDPGHGGQDTGAVSAAGLQEKAVTLDISLRMRRYLSAAGYNVLLTRHQDVFLTLEERPRRATAWNANVLISIHANSSSNTAAAGVETFLLAIPGFASTNHFGAAAPTQLSFEGNRHDAANMTLAFHLQQQLQQATGANERGIRRARFSVLKDASTPAALVEVGFLSNPSEADRLANAEHRERIARALSRGLIEYLGDVQRANLDVPSTP